MKRILIILIVLTFFQVSCDQANPRKVITRTNTSELDGESQSNNISGPGITDAEYVSGADSNGRVVIPKEFTDCNYLKSPTSYFEFNHNHTGKYNICKSNENPNKFSFQLEKAYPTIKVCFIPVTKDSGGSSTYIGEPKCYYPDSEKKSVVVEFIINRPYYQNYPISGIMIMKDEQNYYPAPFNPNRPFFTVDAYLGCMDMLLPPYNDASYCQAFTSLAAQKNLYQLHYL